MGGIHRWRVNSPHKGPVTRKMFPFDDVIIAKPLSELLLDYYKTGPSGTNFSEISINIPRFHFKVLELNTPLDFLFVNNCCNIEAEKKWPAFRKRYFQKHWSGLGRVHKSWVRVRVRVLCLSMSTSTSTEKMYEYEYEYDYFSLSTSTSTSTSYPKY